MSEAYTLMRVPTRMVETVQGIASGKLAAVPLPDHTSVPAEQDPATGRRGLYLVYLPSNPAGIDALHAVWGAEKTARLARRDGGRQP